MTVSKPCAICGKPLSRRAPSELARVHVHKGCQGLWATRRAAFTRLDALEAKLAGYGPITRRIALEWYRLGALQTRDRLRMRDLARRRRQEAAA